MPGESAGSQGLLARVPARAPFGAPLARVAGRAQHDVAHARLFALHARVAGPGLCVALRVRGAPHTEAARDPTLPSGNRAYKQ
eukprot:3744620-Alexandrium_andersonii.AAC.1